MKKKDRLPIFRQRLNELLGDLTTTEFAKKVGLSRQTIGFYLNGDRIPDSAILIQICKTCNVSADYLLGLSFDTGNEIYDKSFFLLEKKARYALSGHSRSLVYQVYGMALSAIALGAITRDQFNQLNEMLVVKGLNDPAHCHLE